MSYYNLPDGTTTKSSRKYIKAWRDLAAPIMKVTGMQIMGFDPGVLFSYEGKTSLDLPVWFLKLINEKLK